MAIVAITPDQDVVTAEIFIAAPPARVFEAITDPYQMPKWWGQQGMYKITEWKGDLRPGGKWSSVGVSVDGSSFRIDGEYLEVFVMRKIGSWEPDFAVQAAFRAGPAAEEFLGIERLLHEIKQRVRVLRHDVRCDCGVAFENGIHPRLLLRLTHHCPEAAVHFLERHFLLYRGHIPVVSEGIEQVCVATSIELVRDLAL